MSALPRRPPHAALLVLVALLHLLLWWAAGRAGGWRERAAPPVPPLQVTAISPPAATAGGADPDAAAPALAPPRPRLPNLPAFAAPAIEWVAPRANDPAPTSAPAAPPAAPTAVPRAAAAPASAPLRLDLPRGAATAGRSPALDDPRVGSRRATVESRIARATAAEWVEELQPDGRVFYRRGDECVLVKPSREAELDPFSGAASPKPRQAGQC